MMGTLLQDLRYGARQLWRSPGFTVAALATLALGIGANTALFTVGRAIMLRPLPGINDSEQLAWVTPARQHDNFPLYMSYPDFVDYRDGLRELADLSVTAGGQFSLSGGGEPERVHGEVVSWNYFSILRTSFALGRGFVAEEDSLGKPRNVVVLSHTIWQRRFSGDSGIVGRSVVVNGQPLTVVGVTSEGFNGADLELPRHVYLPAALHDVARPDEAGGLSRRNRWWLRPIARMRPGVSRRELESAAQLIAARIAAADTAGHKRITARTYSAESGLPAGSDREVTPLAVFASVVTGLVLLIACANVSNLLLARGVSRRREMAIRLSLGASRMRLVRQLFSESVLLAFIASAAGLLMAYAGSDYLIRSGTLPLPLDMTPDRGVIVFSVITATAAAVLFGLVPAFESTRRDIAAAVKDGAVGAGRDPRRSRLQNGFVVTQLALSLVLLSMSGLFLRSMYKAMHVDTGFEATSQVVGISFDLGLQRYTDARAAAFIDALRENAMALPGVQAASFTDVPPMGNRYVGGEVVPEGRQSARAGEFGADNPRIFQATIHPGYFAALDLPIRRGRDFARTDDGSAPAVAIVGEALARMLWPNGDAIGKRLSLNGDEGPWLTVVGVAAEAMLGGPTEGQRSTVYLPQTQHRSNKLFTMLVRTRGEPGPLAEALRRQIRAMDPDLPLYNIQTLAEYKRLKLSDRMNGAAILGGFGALALLLASIGVYGVMAFSVAQRTREIGIRMALGARRADVLSLFVGRGLRLTAIGVVIGGALSLAVSQLMRGMLFGLTPTDGATLLGVALLLTAIAALACWIPARRAARVNPLEALRYE